MAATGAVASVRDIRLDGRVAIVTGAARGLGKAMAEGLARAGASVVFADVDGAALAGATAALEGQPGCGPVAAIACDITMPADGERAIATTVEKFGALHVLVNNAGKGPIHLERSPHTKSLKFWEADPDVWRDIIVTNVNGTFLMARCAAPHLIRAGSGRIVNITTSLPTMQRRANSPYGVSKAAIEAETLIWAKDLEGTGVTVNSLIPGGAADTDFVHAAARVALRAEGRTLLPPAVMVAPIVWLASTLSDGITGARFVGKLWDKDLPPNEAAAKAREAAVLREPPSGAR
jgi:NAD(P)-dependent dehydrogenase (short-subunit alcohol dehydrogenase family)